MKEFTEQELALYDGKNGRPVYFTYDGKVYDVSSNFLWKDGTPRWIGIPKSKKVINVLPE
jgi:predicted heme/steroid binding protein